MSYQNLYLITEGKLDKIFLEKILPTKISENVKILSGSGETSAISLARSRFIDGQNKVLLLLDADTVDKEKVALKKYQTENMIFSLSGPSTAKVVLFVPEIEQLLVIDKPFIEHYFDKKLSDFEYDLIQNDPKFGLLKLSKDKSKPINQVCEEILEKADQNVIQKMQKQEQIQEIIDFFN